MSHSALFTEHTASAVQPVLAHRATVGQLLRLWGLVLIANLAGAAGFAWAASYVGPGLGIADAKAMGDLAGTLVSHSSLLMFLSAIGAGWLMGLLSWLTSAARDSTAQLVLVWLTTYIIGLASLHHSIAGTTEVLMGVFVGQGATMPDFFRFLLWSVLGNAIGGAVFVAVLKTSHVRQSK
jgi:formate/nitrite transporter FocA (FNT family)